MKRILVTVIVALMSTGAVSAAEQPVSRMVVFGNSYSSPGSIKWPAQLQAAGEARSVVNLAVGGSTAGSYSSKNFAQQLQRRPASRAGDVTVVYHGYNDATWAGTAPSKYPGNARVLADYKAGLARLVSSGYTGSGRRLLVVLGHDWAKVPRYATGDARYAAPVVHSTMLALNSGMAAAGRAVGAAVVDLYTAMECVFRNPTKFGFTNTRNMAPSPSAKGYLYGYNDRYHFGAAGQKLISRVVGYYLGAGNVSPARLVSDMAAGRVLGVPCS